MLPLEALTLPKSTTRGPTPTRCRSCRQEHIWCCKAVVDREDGSLLVHGRSHAATEDPQLLWQT